MIKWFEIIANTSIFTAICATSLTFYCMMVMQLERDPYRLYVVFLGTFLSYTALQLLPSSCPKILTSRTSWIKKNKSEFILMMIFASIGIMICVGFLSFYDFINFVHLLVLVLFYENFWGGKKHLRKIPYLKPFLIAYIWTSVAVPPHRIFENYRDNFILWMEVFFLILSLAVPFDIRDMQIDYFEGVKTFANRFPIMKVKLACFMSFFLASLISFNHLTMNLKNFSISLILGVYYLLIISRVWPNQKDHFFIYGLDGIMVMKLVYIL